MSIVISTPAGNIGKRLTARLLDAGEQLTLISRHPEKVAEFAARGAKVLNGSLENSDFVNEATRGAKTLFWLSPPDMQSTDFRARQGRLGRIAAFAVRKNRIPRVVNLSSFGAHHSSGVGVVNGLFDVEQALNATDADVLHLRPTFFMENYLHSIGSIKGMNSIFMPVSGEIKMPMIATRDIADVAAAQILDSSWHGRRTLTLFGPRERSFNENAEVFTNVLNRKINHVAVPGSAAKDAMMGMGLSADVASLMVEFNGAMDSGLVWEGAGDVPDKRGSTDFETFVREVFLPAFNG